MIGIVVGVITWLALSTHHRAADPARLDVYIIRWQTTEPADGTLPYRRIVEVR